MKALVATMLLALAAAAHAASEEVITIPTRPGVTVSYLLVRDPAATPKIVVISFVGAPGAINLAKRAAAGPIKFGPATNYLVRVRERFADAEFADAIVDAPSDRLPEGMSDEFRFGREHETDMRAVIADLRTRFPGARLYLVGTSRGTISAAALGAKLSDIVQGVVLTSTVTVSTRGGGPGLSGFDFATIKVPLLLVHHRQDACSVSPYAAANALSKRFPLVSATGGDPPQSGPCEPQSPHGYFGLDAAVTSAMRAWMQGRDYPREIP
ncbi:MAG TPA: hypothetical protein VMN56_09720 [Casimicrobiaceae bacterium]|nr:hypothetical protein [Casimicrobiaceae bacterium]